jgi:hypothetical protein
VNNSRNGMVRAFPAVFWALSSAHAFVTPRPVRVCADGPPSTRELYVKSIDEELDEVRQGGGGNIRFKKKCWQFSLEPKQRSIGH